MAVNTQPLVNQDAFLKMFGEELNGAMLKAAEPLIQKTLADIEKKMRETLAAKLIGVVKNDYSIETRSDRIVIELKGNPRLF